MSFRTRVEKIRDLLDQHSKFLGKHSSKYITCAEAAAMFEAFATDVQRAIDDEPLLSERNKRMVDTTICDHSDDIHTSEVAKYQNLDFFIRGQSG